MTDRQKEALYDRLVRTLTDYEHPDEATIPVDADDLYTLLVDIQNSWDDLVTPSEEE